MSRSLMKYHPRIGFTYMPGLAVRAPGADGGYLVRTNAAGFRSDREFVRERAPGVFRALLFGDSQAAGDGASNGERFGELLEKATPGLEIFNYALSGSGTDQQYIAYQECAGVEHDLLILAVYVENIRRVSRRIVKSRDPAGDEAYYAKPYFEMENGGLALHNVPVPKHPWSEQSLPPELLPHVYSYEETNFFSHSNRPPSRLAAPLAPLRKIAKNTAMRLAKFQPLPDYDSPDGPEWRLFRNILESWIEASPAPVLLLPIPHHAYLAGTSDPSACQARFRELAEEVGCRLYDPLQNLWRIAAEERCALWSDSAGHLSKEGHAALARLLAPILADFMREHRRAAASQ